MVDIGAHESSSGVGSFVGRKYVVSASSDYGNGSVSQLFPTINHAINAVTEFTGDTILVMDGTYVESLLLKGPNGFDHLTLKSQNGSSNTIIQSAQADQGAASNTYNDGTLTIDGFTLTGGVGWQGAGGIINGETKLMNLMVTGNHAGSRGGGFVIHGGAILDNVEIAGNTVSEEGTGAGGGLLIEVLDNQDVPKLINVNHNYATGRVENG